MIRNGSDLMFFVAGKSIGGATTCQVTVNAELASTSNKDDGEGDWDVQSVKKLNWKGSSDSYLIDVAKGNSYDDLFDLMVAKAPIDVVFSLDKVAADKLLPEAPTTGWTLPTSNLYKGKALITSLDLTAPNGDNVTYKIDFTGIGKYERVEPV